MDVIHVLSLRVVILLGLSLCKPEWTVSAPLTPPTELVEYVTPTIDESARLVDWLTKYGYLSQPDSSTGQLQAWTAVTEALKAMQRFAGLEDTGTLDGETLRLMQSPRCSLPDNDGSQISPVSDTEDHGRRTKREISTWTRRNINWRLRSYPVSPTLSRDITRSLVFYALKVWAEPTLLEFHEVGGPSGADLQIDFLHGFHGDGYPFDGVGGAVGHAFFPSDSDRAGEVHLDAQEDWAFRQPASKGTDTFTVLVHELGHALGLSHSSARGSVMRPYYQGPLGDPLHFNLGSSDLELITALYGKRGDPLQTDSPLPEADVQLNQRGESHKLTHRYPQSHQDSHMLDRCNTSFDAVAKIRGETFFFKGLSMWRVHTGGLISRKAVSVRRLWAALPTSLPPLRAVLERHEDHAIIFISGSQFWMFKDLSLEDGFPKLLSDLSPAGSDAPGYGLHWDPDKGVTWGPVEKEGDKREEENHMWTELTKEGVNGIIKDNNGSLYLFKGSSYWKFSHPFAAPEKGYPRPVATDWLNCPDPTPHNPAGVSLTSITGQLELQKRKNQGAADQIRHRDKTAAGPIQDQKDCHCFNEAMQYNMGLVLVMLSLLLHMGHIY
ncbi:matrix metalloproteinase-17b [Trichomycterus rosablanca]|uniref:matrix metalloproteinase-17b n=1 Tax=Trichomycterus rosablanca TaxID=2290929 RepID=UPI002F35CD1C